MEPIRRRSEDPISVDKQSIKRSGWISLLNSGIMYQNTKEYSSSSTEKGHFIAPGVISNCTIFKKK